MQNTDASGIPVQRSVSRRVAFKADGPLSTNFVGSKWHTLIRCKTPGLAR